MKEFSIDTIKALISKLNNKHNEEIEVLKQEHKKELELALLEKQLNSDLTNKQTTPEKDPQAVLEELLLGGK